MRSTAYSPKALAIFFLYAVLGLRQLRHLVYQRVDLTYLRHDACVFANGAFLASAIDTVFRIPYLRIVSMLGDTLKI